MPCQPGAHLGLLVGRIIVENDVDGLVGRQFGFDGVEEPDELLMPVTLHVAADHRSIEDIERGEQGGGAISLVVVGHGRPAATLEWQPWLRAIKRLDMALFVNRQHDGVGWRRDIKPDNIVKLLGKGFVIRLRWSRLLVQFGD